MQIADNGLSGNLHEISQFSMQEIPRNLMHLLSLQDKLQAGTS